MISKFQPVGDHLTEESYLLPALHRQKETRTQNTQVHSNWQRGLQALNSFSFLLWQHLCLTKPSPPHTILAPIGPQFKKTYLGALFPTQEGHTRTGEPSYSCEAGDFSLHFMLSALQLQPPFCEVHFLQTRCNKPASSPIFKVFPKNTCLSICLCTT